MERVFRSVSQSSYEIPKTWNCVYTICPCCICLTQRKPLPLSSHGLLRFMNSTAVNMTTCQGQFKRSGRRRAVLQGRTNTKWKLFWKYPFHLSKSSKWKKYLSLFPRLLFVWLFHYCLFTLIRLPSWHIVSNCAMCIYGTYKYVLLQNHLNDLYTNETDAFLKLYFHSRKSS